jgi:Ca2+-binding RTX toxin-like protein
VWLNDGSGNFSASSNSLGNSSSKDVSLGDVDGDGDLDAFVANDYHRPNRLWVNDGSGNFSAGSNSLGDSWSRGVNLGDLDGDGDLDAFVANGGFQPNRVWLNHSRPPIVLVPHDPPGPATVIARRDGDNVEVVVDGTGEVLLSRPLDSLMSITVMGADDDGDTLIVDMRWGGSFALPGRIRFHGGADGSDRLSFIAPDGAATYRLDDDALSAPGLVIGHDGVEQFEITDGGGDDTYELSATDKHCILNDSGGTEVLDFSGATSRIVVNLALMTGQTQNLQGGGNTLALTGEFENVYATPWDDSILGNTADNTFIGYAGNDTLIGQSGNDTLDGGEGNDSIYSGPGEDTARGGPGDDRIWGGRGTDDLDAGSGDDEVRAGGANDVVRGGEGNDELRGGSGNDVLIGGDGSDRPVDGGNSGRVHGGVGRDLLIGGLGDDLVEGMVDEDILIGGATIHDDNTPQNNAALTAIIAEWSVGGVVNNSWIDTRINHLLNGGGLNGDATLDATSVLDDATHDCLWGAYARDWFITYDLDEFAPDEPGNRDRHTEL